MLTRLARWLRAAGYDAELVAQGMDDRDLMAHAISTDRMILTRDRKFLERRGSDKQVFLIISGHVDEQVKEITGPLKIDWLKAPFTRCLMDNASVVPACEKDAARLPPGWLGEPATLMSCPDCGRLYWVGGHTRRMQRKLAVWAQK